MSKRNTRVYDNEFKHNAVNLYNEGGRSHKELTEDLGIPRATLTGWVHERENERLKRERDILKKTLAIFSLP